MDTVTWTDEKIDVRIDDRFDRLEVGSNVRFDRSDDNAKARFDQVDLDMKVEFTRMDAKFDALNRTLLQIGGGLIGTLIAGILTLVVLALTH
jgi:hypothetical protein